VAEVRAIGGPPAEPAAPWLARAEARLAAEEAVERLQGRAAALLGARP
jgi:hypothetical protein